MPRRDRANLNLRIDRALAEEVRQFCKDFAGKPAYLTLTGFAERALKAELARLKRELEGEASPRRRSSPVDNARS